MKTCIPLLDRVTMAVRCMPGVLVLATVLVGAGVADAQTFNRRYDPFGQGLAQEAWSIVPTVNGQALVLGSGGYIAPGGGPVFAQMALHLDTAGQQLSAGRMIAPGAILGAGGPNSAAVMPNGDVILGGAIGATIADIDPAVLRWSATGDSLAVVAFPQPGDQWQGLAARPTPDNGIILCGRLSGPDLNTAFLLKVDSLGAQQWLQLYGTVGPQEAATSVVAAPDGGFYFGGVRDVGPTNADPWVVRTDALGNVLWSVDIGTPEDELYGTHVSAAANGDLICASGWNYQGSQRYVNGLARVDTSGTVLWWHTYGPDRYVQAMMSARECANGDIIAAGRSLSITLGEQGVMLRTNAQGDSLWMRYYYYQDSLMSDGKGVLNDVWPTADGGFMAVGEAYGSNSGNDPLGLSVDMWVLKVDSLGCVEPGCDLITGLQAVVANHRDALQVSPNPATHRVQVRWSLPGSAATTGPAELWLTSATGAVVGTWPCDLAGGSIDLDVSDVAAGVHHLHLVHAGTWLSGTRLLLQ